MQALQVRPVLSVSRDGVNVHTDFLDEVPSEWIDAAKQERLDLLSPHDIDRQRVYGLATHGSKTTFGRELEPIEPQAAAQ